MLWRRRTPTPVPLSTRVVAHSTAPMAMATGPLNRKNRDASEWMHNSQDKARKASRTLLHGLCPGTDSHKNCR